MTPSLITSVSVSGVVLSQLADFCLVSNYTTAAQVVVVIAADTDDKQGGSVVTEIRQRYGAHSYVRASTSDFCIPLLFRPFSFIPPDARLFQSEPLFLLAEQPSTLRSLTAGRRFNTSKFQFVTVESRHAAISLNYMHIVSQGRAYSGTSRG